MHEATPSIMVHSPVVDMQQKPSLHAHFTVQGGNSKITSLSASMKSFLSLVPGDGHYSPSVVHTPGSYAFEYIVTRRVRWLSYMMWAPPMKHLHCPLKHRGAYFMPIFSPYFIRTNATPYSQLTTPAPYMRAPATPRHTHLLSNSPSSNL